ncbi:prepilin-type N-terminal cleavage/methylation domain-containing protein [Patescibacteria group bacterium]|nr:prepilin-type N-terminal cleavage/methylation domain-containing protein [Patescibacteria group bacterium]MBU4481119.1 prepilin-type N-terminal cleavage/methylation domain-containing protein [Patescibacteria group bacterium]
MIKMDLSCQKNFSKASTGFTLIETIVAIFVFTLIFGAVSGLIMLAYKTYNYTWQQSIAIDEARRGIETMVKEIRGAKSAEDGSYPIEKAEDKEFIFYSDVDNDGETEKVRYFLGNVRSGTQAQECQTSVAGGTCGVAFSNFLLGTLKTAEVKVSVDGDFDWGPNKEYAEIYADTTNYLGRICNTGCTHCAGTWQGTQTYNVINYASDNSITFLADASLRVEPQCPYAMKSKFEFSWTEEIAGQAYEFRKGVIEPVGSPPTYPASQEKISIISSYIRNTPPIFEYFDQNGNKITIYPARLKDTKLMKVFLVVDVNENQPPSPFELESSVQLRNLKEE